MMARGSDAPSMGRIQKRKTNLSKSSLSACNARPVHTDGPTTDVRLLNRLHLLPLEPIAETWWSLLKPTIAGGSGIDASSLVFKLLPACDTDAPNLAATAALKSE